LTQKLIGIKLKIEKFEFMEGFKMERVTQIITLILWGISLYLWVQFGWWYLFAFLFALHFFEIFAKGIPIGKKAGYSLTYSVLMTLIYGIIWWKPVNDKMNRGASDK
jgi:hypothetical protein